MTQDKHDPRLPVGQTTIFDRLTLIDGTKMFVPRDEAQALIRDGLARPERLYRPATSVNQVGTGGSVDSEAAFLVAPGRPRT